MQTQHQTFVEVLFNTAVGFGVAVLGQILIFPLFGLRVSVLDNLWIGTIFTVLSLLRNYFVRRLFCWWDERKK